MISSLAVQNKAIVLKAFDTLFNERDYVAAEYYWSTDYIQHSAHIEPGRDGLFNMIKRSPASLKYQSGIVMAEDDLVIVHGRFYGFSGAANWVSANVVRIKDRILVEHWDVLQEEETRERSAGQSPMYDRSHLA
jgi:predicted SnoaL-like aldol condensation-catalyzing enzyme